LPSSYSIPHLYESEIKALVRAGYYSSKSDVVKDAIRHLLETKSNLKLAAAIQMYITKEVSLSKGAEIAGLTLIEFKEILKDRGIKIDSYVPDRKSNVSS
jgi:predicted HTH domain antitoxin